MLVELNIQEKEADGKRQICEAEERACNVQKEAANALATDCQRELD